MRYADDSVQKCKIEILWWYLLIFFCCCWDENSHYWNACLFSFSLASDKDGLETFRISEIARVESLPDHPRRPSTSQHDNPHRLRWKKKILNRMGTG